VENVVLQIKLMKMGFLDVGRLSSAAIDLNFASQCRKGEVISIPPIRLLVTTHNNIYEYYNPRERTTRSEQKSKQT
jgi:hypothetical protein